MRLRTIYPDLEFVPDDPTVRGTLAVAVVDDRDSEFYRINHDVDLRAVAAHDFLMDYVVPYLPLTVHRTPGLPRWLSWDPYHPDFALVMPASYIAADLAVWLEPWTAPADDYEVRCIGYYGSGDLTRLHGLYGNDWQTMPEHLPREPFDLAAAAKMLGVTLPGVEKGAVDPHHPLSDARHHRDLHRSLIGKTLTIS